MEFHRRFYIPAIQKLAFDLPHVRNIGMNHCGKIFWEEFKHRAAYQGVLCHRDYAQRVVDIFAHKIQYEYYGGNRLMSI